MQYDKALVGSMVEFGKASSQSGVQGLRGSRVLSGACESGVNLPLIDQVSMDRSDQHFPYSAILLHRDSTVFLPF